MSELGYRLRGNDDIELISDFLTAIAQQRGWLSGEHFSVDGTLIQA